MSARQEKVREALKLVPPQPGVLGEINDAILAAALAEVEEWETRLAAAEMLAAEWLNDAKGVPMDEALREIRAEIKTRSVGDGQGC